MFTPHNNNKQTEKEVQIYKEKELIKKCTLGTTKKTTSTEIA